MPTVIATHCLPEQSIGWQAYSGLERRGDRKCPRGGLRFQVAENVGSTAADAAVEARIMKKFGTCDICGLTSTNKAGHLFESHGGLNPNGSDDTLPEI